MSLELSPFQVPDYYFTWQKYFFLSDLSVGRKFQIFYWNFNYFESTIFVKNKRKSDPCSAIRTSIFLLSNSAVQAADSSSGKMASLLQRVSSIAEKLVVHSPKKVRNGCKLFMKVCWLFWYITCPYFDKMLCVTYFYIPLDIICT